MAKQSGVKVQSQANGECYISSSSPTHDSEQNGEIDHDSSFSEPEIRRKKAEQKKTVIRANIRSTKVRSERDMEVIRLIGQHLQDMGLYATANYLMEESGCILEHPLVARVRECVMIGDWEKADRTIRSMKSLVKSVESIRKMQFLLLEQKYLELLEDHNVLGAMRCLQLEISPLRHNRERVHELSCLLMCGSAQQLRTEASWQGRSSSSRQKLLERLQEYLPHSVMLPPHRLKLLLTQAMQHQKDECPFHNTSEQPSYEKCSLLLDHICTKNRLPTTTSQILTEHTDEVWFCRFSPDGQYLATGGKDGSLILWSVNAAKHRVYYERTLNINNAGIAYIAWSPDSKYFIVCGPQDTCEILVYEASTGELRTRISNSPDDSLTVACWHEDSKHFVAGGMRGQFYQIDLYGTLQHSWEGLRVQALACLDDGATAIAADYHNRVKAYNFSTLTDRHLLEEEQAVMSMTLDNTFRFALLNIAKGGLHMWDLQQKVLVQRFEGVTQGQIVIHSCFGGVSQDFVASGSEDNAVYFWHVSRGQPIAVLDGHSRSVNCIHWNPQDPEMLASASDDRTVRIWTTSAAAESGLHSGYSGATGASAGTGLSTDDLDVL